MIIIKTIENLLVFLKLKAELTSYLECKYRSMLDEYGCSMADIGEAQVLDDLEELFKIYGKCTLHSF